MKPLRTIASPSRTTPADESIGDVWITPGFPTSDERSARERSCRVRTRFDVRTRLSAHRLALPLCAAGSSFAATCRGPRIARPRASHARGAPRDVHARHERAHYHALPGPGGRASSVWANGGDAGAGWGSERAAGEPTSKCPRSVRTSAAHPVLTSRTSPRDHRCCPRIEGRSRCRRGSRDNR